MKMSGSSLMILFLIVILVSSLLGVPDEVFLFAFVLLVIVFFIPVAMIVAVISALQCRNCKMRWVLKKDNILGRDIMRCSNCRHIYKYHHRAGGGAGGGCGG